MELGFVEQRELELGLMEQCELEQCELELSFVEQRLLGTIKNMTMRLTCRAKDLLGFRAADLGGLAPYKKECKP